MARLVRKPHPSPLCPTAGDATEFVECHVAPARAPNTPHPGCGVPRGTHPGAEHSTPRAAWSYGPFTTASHPLATVDRMRGGAVTQASAGPAACLSAYRFGAGDPTTQ